VTALAVAGRQVAWIRTIAGNTEVDATLFTAILPKPDTHSLITARRTGDPPTSGASIGGLVGSGSLIAVNTWQTNTATLRTITGSVLNTVATGTGTALAESADLGRVAVLRSDGTVALYSAAGAVLRTIAPSSAREVALRKDYLLVLTKTKTLEIYNANTGVLIRAWPVPGGATHLDLYGGIAVYSVWRTLHALQLTTGKDIVLASLKRAVVADEIEAPGVVYAFDTVRGIHDLGNLVFVPMRSVTAALR
jgi:hypothetical protein